MGGESRPLPGVPDKPYAIGEWGLARGIDHPDFVQKMANFVVQPPAGRDDHLLPEPELARTSTSAYKPKSRAAYKKYILPLG